MACGQQCVHQFGQFANKKLASIWLVAIKKGRLRDHAAWVRVASTREFAILAHDFARYSLRQLGAIANRRKPSVRLFLQFECERAEIKLRVAHALIVEESVAQ